MSRIERLHVGCAVILIVLMMVAFIVAIYEVADPLIPEAMK